LSCKADVSRFRSVQEAKTRHQFVTKNRRFDLASGFTVFESPAHHQEFP